MKKRLMLLACGLLIGGLTACGNTSSDVGNGSFDDGMDFEQNTDVEEVVYNASVVGTSWASRDPKASMTDENCKLSKDETQENVYTIEIDVKTTDEFKIVLDGSWTSQYGMEDIDWDKSTSGLLVGKKEDYNKGTSDRSGIKITKDAKVKIEYHPYYFINKECNNFLILTEVTE